MSGFLKFFGIHKAQNNPEAKVSIEKTAQQDQPPSLAPKDGTEDKIALLKTYLSAADLPHAFYALTEAGEGQKFVVWVDWRDEDDGIVSCFEDILQTGSLEVEMNNTDDEIGFEIVISYKGERHKVPYQGKGADRDTTLVTLNEILTPDYEIRFCKHSDGNDTLAFLPLSAAQWRELENEFGDERMNTCFARLSKGSKLFG